MDIKTINDLIDKEKAFAMEVNPQMALGMAQIQKVLNDYYNKSNK